MNFDLLCPRILLRPQQITAADTSNVHGTVGPNAAQIYQKYLEIGARYCGPVQTVDDPTLPANNGGVSIVSFLPNQSPKSNLNNHSIVTVIEYQGVNILSPGDNEPPSWEELLEDAAFEKAIENTHVLVAPHHGRVSGFHRPLFDHISPLLTIISDGRFVDTSATGRYSAQTKGWNVQKRSGGTENRKCVTTRNDGAIGITIEPNPYGTGYLSVSIA